MNRNIIRSMLFAAAAVAAIGAWAETETVGGIERTCRIYGDTAEVE